MAPKPAHLAPSELGTKEYWDALYATELANHAGNPADTGTVWFDDVDAESCMVAYLGDLMEEDGNVDTDAAALRILDLGSGNGSLLRAVRAELAARAVPHARLLGVDYSAASVDLARRVAAADTEADTDTDTATLPIHFAEWDVLHGDAAALGQAAGTWDLVLDKGTFDAISLGHTAAADTVDTVDTVETLYRRQVLRLLRPGGRFLVTSCNWTEAELEAWMAADGAETETADGVLLRVGQVAYPSFQFGGQQGTAVCTLCFVKG